MFEAKKKILCVCQEGNNRSVVLASVLKNEKQFDAIAIGIRKSSLETQTMLFDWADIIILVDDTFKDEIPVRYVNKLKIWNVGQDRFFNGFNQELLNMYRQFIRQEWPL